jgi:hypothetical protein
MDEPWTIETINKARKRAEIYRVEAELASEPRKTELLETALAYERMIERAKRHFGLKDEQTNRRLFLTNQPPVLPPIIDRLQ